MNQEVVEDYTLCKFCDNPFPHCHCKCPYCSERDKCECALGDAATGFLNIALEIDNKSGKVITKERVAKYT